MVDLVRLVVAVVGVVRERLRVVAGVACGVVGGGRVGGARLLVELEDLGVHVLFDLLHLQEVVRDEAVSGFLV